MLSLLDFCYRLRIVVEYYLSNMQTINFALDRTRFQDFLIEENVLTFLICWLFDLPFKAITV